jgi:hypothetical protein
MSAMRILIGLALIAAGCGGKSAPPKGPSGPAAIAPDFAATRWVPAQPTYVFALKSLHDLEGVAAGFASPDDVKAALGQATTMGIDVDGGVALFSEGLDPTLVVHLAAPDTTAKLLAGFASAPCVNGTCTRDVKFGTLTATIDHDWLWLHITHKGSTDTADWFAHSQAPSGATWADDWHFATGLHEHASKLVGFVNAHAVLAKIAQRAEAAAACTQLVAPVQRVGFAFDGDLQHLDARVSIDLGTAAGGVARAIVPPPAGWDKAFSAAPFVFEDNVDFTAIAAWLQPCAALFGGDDLAELTGAGVRTARFGLLSADPDNPLKARGAVALDLTDRKTVGSLLDRIPMRKTFERDHDFGGLHGHRISIPTQGTVDYVLDDHVALAALGDGLLEQVVAGTAAPTSRLFAIDVRPAAMPADAWKSLLEQVGVHDADVIATQLTRWQDAHAGVTLDHGALVFEVAGNRK